MLINRAICKELRIILSLRRFDFSVPETPPRMSLSRVAVISAKNHKRQKPQAPTPQAPIRNRQTRKVAKAKNLNRNTNLA